MVTDSPDTETAPVQPRTTSLNESDFRAADIAAGPLAVTEAAQAVAPGAGATDVPPAPRISPNVRRASGRRALDYSLMRAPSYENIVGGEAPSPFVSLIMLLGLLGLLAAAVATGLGYGSPEWWLFGFLFTIIATTLAAFISRSA
ncbi:MAG: hypothetical protein AVDCRST_MAG77-4572 [uncultured Chloroflexi bacterium]|uniref:Uncharacterized protein n=1 Tax=uncultured Chloroflexota bacterium TaxID=166587 RepID=A0A6J4JWE9_9CHLR|nr:MAG: hypothetical protein AVDCRST_MAG77-4572 [uncultured Chloroflexota bacterium]